MDQIIAWVSDNIGGWLASHAWIGTALGILLAIHTCLKSIRDAIDKTPDTDDNWFEKFVTVSGKAMKYLATGIRPKGPTVK